MTLRELVERELEYARDSAHDALCAMESAKISAARTAHNDSDLMMPGVGLAHAALEIAKLRTKFDAARERVSLLEYLLREDEAERALSNQHEHEKGENT